MNLLFTSDFIIYNEKKIDSLYESFKSGLIFKELTFIGEELYASKVKERKWGNEDEDKDFIFSIMRYLGIFNNPDINFNKGVTEFNDAYDLNDGFQNTGTIILENNSSDFYKLRLLNYSVSSPVINITKVDTMVNNDEEKIILNYNISIENKTKKRDYFERICIITNYSTYIFKISIICEDGFNFSEKISIKTLDEFFKLYKEDIERAKYCYSLTRFKEWLEENKYYDELLIYKKLRYIKNPSISLQNFLQILGYDIVPVMNAKFLDGTIVIKNSGMGYLYGTIKCPPEVDAELYEWQLDGETTFINARGKGVIKILSNGGCQDLFIDDNDVLEMSLLKKEKKLNLSNVLKKVKVIEGLADLPKISVDNDYVKVHLDENYDIVIERNISIFAMLKAKLKKYDYESNLKIVYPDIIYYYKIKLV